jgi:molybdopterin-guanine dinucleotide biosynthesis protein A
MIQDCIGLVLCGGKSLRMGSDKSFLNYHDQPQYQWCHHMLTHVCCDVLISCHPSQQARFEESYRLLPDHSVFNNSGPIASLLTGFASHPDRDILVVGCDYPHLSLSELKSFAGSVETQSVAHIFYNKVERLYEPVLGWYSRRCADLLRTRFQRGEFSLQGFLTDIQASKYIPAEMDSIKSIDTPELKSGAFASIKKNTYATDR